jgi:hypothetical protein
MRHRHSVEPSLGWSYRSRDALACAKAQMDEEPTGVSDDIGVLTIHQGDAGSFPARLCGSRACAETARSPDDLPAKRECRHVDSGGLTLEAG